MKRVLGTVALVSCIWVLAPALAIGQSIADRAITNITGDVYLVQDGSQYTVFLVTPNGIILGDPLFLTTAKWLKDELAVRFPNRPVKYVLHTSPNFERAAGAEVFKPAQVVAQEEFVREVTAAYSSLPREYANLDRNGNGILERTEFAGTPAEPVFAVRDLDSDGNVTRQELYGLIAVGLVTSTYLADRMITLDGRSVELVHPGRARTADAAVLYFPAERVLFTGDMIALQSLPETVGRYSLGEYIAALRTIEGLAFDTLITGRGERGTRGDIVAFRMYLEALLEGVRAARQRGQSVEQVQGALRLNDYAGWGRYGTHRATNIAETYSSLRELTVGVYGASTLVHLGSGTVEGGCFPTAAWECVAPAGTVPGMVAGLLVSRRFVSVSGELGLGRTFHGTRRFLPIQTTGEYFDHRDTIAAALVRVRPVHTPRMALDVGVGPSIVLSKTQFAVRRQVEGLNETTTLSSTQISYVFGADANFRVKPGFSVFVPVRFAGTPRPPELGNFRVTMSNRTVSVGVGVSVDIARHVR